MAETTRREMLRGGARWALAVAGVAGTAALATKRGDACANRYVCAGCGELGRCGLPQAQAARAKEESHGR